MNITEIRIYPKQDNDNNDNFKGTASITIDDCIVIHGIAIVDGKNGMFISFPARKLRTNGNFVDIVHPIKTEVRQEIQEAILQKYREVI